MLAGRRLFRGQSLSEMLAAVIKDQPDVSHAPPQVHRILKRCLEKDPAKRLRDIGDVWDLLAETSAVAAAPPVIGGAGKLPWISAGVLAAIAAAFAVLWWNVPAPVFRATEFLVSEPPGAAFANQFAAVSPSPDGRYVVFGARLPGSGLIGLWLRQFDSLDARPLPGTERGNDPTWSPDSKSLVFFSERKLKRLEIGGGAPVVLADATYSPVGITGTWNREGVILHGGPDGLHRVLASGGAPALLTNVNPELKETGHGFPQFLPDGRRFLYFVASEDASVQGVYAASLDQPGSRTLIVRTGNKAVYAPPRGNAPGYLLWLQGQTLLAQQFDPDSLALAGDPASVAQGIGFNVSAPVRAGYWADGGALVYRPDVGVRRAVLWKGADGKDLGDAMPADSVDGLRLSPDGQTLAVSRKVGLTASDIWLWEFGRGGVFTRLTFCRRSCKTA
jgi:WD40 repeat protein